VLVSRLSLEEPKRQRFSRAIEVQRLDPGLLELQLALHAPDHIAQLLHRIQCARRIDRVGVRAFEHGRHHASRARAREA